MPLYGQIPYKLRRWVPEKMLDWECLHHNPKASEYLKEKPNKINWIILADNPDTIEVIEEFLEKRIYLHYQEKEELVLEDLKGNFGVVSRPIQMDLDYYPKIMI